VGLRFRWKKAFRLINFFASWAKAFNLLSFFGLSSHFSIIGEIIGKIGLAVLRKTFCSWSVQLIFLTGRLKLCHWCLLFLLRVRVKINVKKWHGRLLALSKQLLSLLIRNCVSTHCQIPYQFIHTSKLRGSLYVFRRHSGANMLWDSSALVLNTEIWSPRSFSYESMIVYLLLILCLSIWLSITHLYCVRYARDPIST
jgi:hypothetical protein